MLSLISTPYGAGGYSDRSITLTGTDVRYCVGRRQTSGTPLVACFRSLDGSVWTDISMPDLGITGSVNDPAICLDPAGRVHIVGTGDTSSSYVVKHVSYDGSSWSAVHTLMSSGSLSYFQVAPAVAASPAGSMLVAAWCGRDSSTPTRSVMKWVTSGDGGATWSGWSNVPNGGLDCTKVSLAVASTTEFLVCARFFDPNTTTYYVYFNRTGNGGTSWDGWTSIAGATSHPGGPSAVRDSTGALHVAWAEAVSLYYRRRSAAGTWDAAQLIAQLTQGDRFTAVQIALAWNNAPVVVAQTTTGIRYYRSDGSSWRAPVQLTDGTYFIPAAALTTTSGKALATTCDTHIEYYYLEEPLVHAPYPPVNLTREGFDAADAALFSWTFSDQDLGDSQTAYRLEISRVSDNVVVVDTGKVLSTSTQHNLPASTLTNNVQYRWRVKTWDTDDLEGNWSEYAQFWCSAKPTASITVPASDGYVWSGPALTTEWSYSDPEGGVQSAYRVRLTDGGDLQLWDSGKVSGANTAKAIDYTLANGGSYKVKVTVWDDKQVASLEVTRTFSVTYTPPNTPGVNLYAESAEGRITIQITNPPPTPPTPDVEYNEIFRREQGGSSWTRIATRLGANATYYDYTPASGVTYEYFVRAVASSTAIADSVVGTASITIAGVMLHDVTDPTTLHNFLVNEDRTIEFAAPMALIPLVGRDLPMAEFGDTERRAIILGLKLLEADSDRAAIEALVQRKSTICYRDSRGRKAFCVIPELSYSDTPVWAATSIRLEVISYSEEV